MLIKQNLNVGVFSLRAILVHHSFSALGGAELVAIATMEALHEMGFKIDLVTITKPQATAVKKTFNINLEVENVKSVLPPNANYKKSIYSQLLLQLLTIPLVLGSKASLIINTHADFPLPYFKHRTPLISYVHFPHIPHLHLTKDYPPRYQRSPFWKLYFGPYDMVSSWIAPFLISTLKRSVVITNSEFSREAIKREVPEAHPIVVRPPVDTKAFASASTSNYRENKVLVIGRIAPEKQLERAIEVCKLLDIDVKMTIAGSFEHSPRAFNYLRKLEQMIERYELKNRVKILVNISRDDLKKQMMTAKVYLHTKDDEHFGISVVEACSAGLIPIVSARGGPAEFIPKRYHYRTLEDAAELVKRYLDVSKSERLAIGKIARRFSKERFKLAIKRIICSVLEYY